MTAQTVCTWLAIVSAIAAGAARFSALEERQSGSVTWITQLSAESKDQRERIEKMREDGTILERLHQIDVRLERIETIARERPRR